MSKTSKVSRPVLTTKRKSQAINHDEGNKISKKKVQKNKKKSVSLDLSTHKEEDQNNDEKYAQELQAQLNKQEEEENDMIECCCCYTLVPFEKVAQCPEGHLFCKDCVQMSIETALSEGRIRTDCLCTDGCDCKISRDELERILPKSLLKRIDETEAFNATTNANIQGLRTCWKCGYKIIDDDDDDNRPFICPSCNEKTCKKCGKKFHYGKSCHKANRDPKRYVEEKMSEAIVRQCPKCNIQYVKDEGCNHMTCPNCHTQFCYLCGKSIINVRLHYKKCRQFMDNAKYNKAQIMNARKKAMKKYGLTH